MTEKSKILIIDDDPIGLATFSQFLTNQGFEVVGMEHPKGYEEVIAQGGFSLVLLDLMLPEIPGLEILLKLRDQFSNIDLPIIMITSKTDKDNVVTALKFGANDYIQKTFDFNVALNRINTHISLSKAIKAEKKKAEFETLKAMIVTYNHRINNPLTVAISNLQLAKAKPQEVTKFLDGAYEALMRIAEIVKKISELKHSPNLEKEKYVGDSKMYKIS